MVAFQVAQAQEIAHPGPDVELIVLGTVQDGGLPHPGCGKACCTSAANQDRTKHTVVSLGVIDHITGTRVLFEATPDITAQVNLLNTYARNDTREFPDAIFLTHAHIGHYTGLMYLGKEALGGQDIPVYAMPRMSAFLKANGPWNQLVNQGNITVISLAADSTIQVTPNLRVTPFLVPHRDEYSETVGYRIEGPNKHIVFIPDINKWNVWEHAIGDLIDACDIAFLDATFFSGEEIGHRDISAIPHPFVIETMALFRSEAFQTTSRIHFIHLNHTNPLLNLYSEEANTVISEGFRIALPGLRIRL